MIKIKKVKLNILLCRYIIPFALILIFFRFLSTNYRSKKYAFYFCSYIINFVFIFVTFSSSLFYRLRLNHFLKSNYLSLSKDFIDFSWRLTKESGLLKIYSKLYDILIHSSFLCYFISRQATNSNLYFWWIWNQSVYYFRMNIYSNLYMEIDMHHDLYYAMLLKESNHENSIS